MTKQYTPVHCSFENIYLRLFSVLPRAVPVTTGVVSGPLQVGGQNEGGPVPGKN